MRYDSDRHHRRSIRLKGYDYSRMGYYYVTICVQDRKKLFGGIDDGVLKLNDASQIIDWEWNQIPKRFECVILDEYVIMPDHFHAILQIFQGNNGQTMNNEIVGTSFVGVRDPDIIPTHNDVDKIGTGMKPDPTLFEIIGVFKSITTNRYISGVKQCNWPRFRKRLWQLRYHDRIIRDDGELNRIRKYINDNPLNWTKDGNNS